MHGGMQTHHFMRSAALPGFSNAWGLLLLPGLAAWAGWRIEGRLATGTRPPWVLAAGVLALTAGLVLSAAFRADAQDLAGAVFLGILLVAAVLPVCRAECWLGLVVGMVFTFGPVIPSVIGAVIATLSALIHLALKPAMVRGWAALRRA
jgi:hypothetical protein